jgi:hypothetical protein
VIDLVAVKEGAFELPVGALPVALQQEQPFARTDEEDDAVRHENSLLQMQA